MLVSGEINNTCSKSETTIRPRAQKKSADSYPMPCDTIDIEKKDKKKWTVLAYINGNDLRLSKLAPGVLRELEAAGSDANLDIAAQVSRQGNIIDNLTGDWSGTRRYHVIRNENPPSAADARKNIFLPPYTKNIASDVIEDLGKNIDSASPETISDFLEWGIKNYPAEHYAVLIFGQGGGFAGSLADEKNENFLDNKKLAGVLESASKTAEKKIDLVAFDGNLMSQLEVADEIKDAAGIFVASEGAVKYGSLPIDSVIKNLKFDLADGSEITPEALANYFLFEQTFRQRPVAELESPTLSTIDLQKIEPLKNAFGDFAAELANAISQKPELKNALREDMAAVQAFVPQNAPEPYKDYRDIGHFAKIIMADKRFNSPEFSQINKKAGRVLDALSGAIIGESHIGKSVKNASGISTYMPQDYGFDMPVTFDTPPGWNPMHGYEDTSIAKDTKWDELLGMVSKDTKLHSILKDIGFSNNLINKTDKIIDGVNGLIPMLLGAAGNIGGFNSFQVMRGAEPISSLQTAAVVTAQVGMVYSTINGAKSVRQLLDAIADERLGNRNVAIADGAADVLTSVSAIVAGVGVCVAGLAPIAVPAGLACGILPALKIGYEVYDEYAKITHSDYGALDKFCQINGKSDGLNRTDKVDPDLENDKTYVSMAASILEDVFSQKPVDPKLMQSRKTARAEDDYAN